MTKIIHDRIRWLLAALAVLLMSGGISAATETAPRLYDSTLLTKTVRTDDGEQYTHLSWLGLDATSMPGAPEMPVEYIRFIVPVYTNNFRVTVTTGGLSRQTLDAPVFPSQEPVPTSYEGPVEFTVPDPQYYSATQPMSVSGFRKASTSFSACSREMPYFFARESASSSRPAPCSSCFHSSTPVPFSLISPFSRADASPMATTT